MSLQNTVMKFISYQLFVKIFLKSFLMRVLYLRLDYKSNVFLSFNNTLLDLTRMDQPLQYVALTYSAGPIVQGLLYSGYTRFFLTWSFWFLGVTCIRFWRGLQNFNALLDSVNFVLFLFHSPLSSFKCIERTVMFEWLTAYF